MQNFPLTVVDNYYQDFSKTKSKIDNLEFKNSDFGYNSDSLHKLDPKLFDQFCKKFFLIFYETDLTWWVDSFFQKESEKIDLTKFPQIQSCLGILLTFFDNDVICKFDNIEFRSNPNTSIFFEKDNIPEITKNKNTTIQISFIQSIQASSAPLKRTNTDELIVDSDAQILLIGDSWARGIYDPVNTEWIPGFDSILESYNIRINNLSIPGASNKQVIERLELELQNRKTPINKVIWFQTDPMRDLKSSSQGYYMDQIISGVTQFNSIEVYVNEYLKDNVYKKLQMLAERYNFDIIAVGGCSKVNSKIQNEFNRFQKIIPSIPEILIKNLNDTVFYSPEGWADSEYADFVKKSKNKKLLDEWYKITGDIISKRESMYSCIDYFYPDPHHPNHNGHVIIADILRQLL